MRIIPALTTFVAGAAVVAARSTNPSPTNEAFFVAGSTTRPDAAPSTTPIAFTKQNEQEDTSSHFWATGIAMGLSTVFLALNRGGVSSLAHRIRGVFSPNPTLNTTPQTAPADTLVPNDATSRNSDTAPIDSKPSQSTILFSDRTTIDASSDEEAEAEYVKVAPERPATPVDGHHTSANNSPAP